MIVISWPFFLDFEYNIDYPQNHINNGFKTKTNSASECLELCYNTENCVGFSWGNPNFSLCPNGCWLKHTMDVKNSYTDVISGFASTYKLKNILIIDKEYQIKNVDLRKQV